MEEFARILGSYHRSLVREGIPADNAMYLTHSYAEAYWDAALHRCCPCGTGPAYPD